MVTRSFLVEDQAYEVAGLSDQDPYLSSIHGRFEPKFQRFCSMLPPDAVAMDIGANIGVTSIILGHYLPQGRVFALEPGKTIFGLLERNLKHSGRQNVTPLNCAVSDQTQVLRFVEQSAYGHLDANAAACSPEDEGAVKTYALDDLVDELKLDRLDFIKVDVEGFEPEFFEGARRTLARFNPVVYFELNSWCLIDHGGHNPIEFMTKIVGDFRFVYRVNNNTDSDTVLDKVVSSHLAQALVHANIALHGSIDDIVVVNDESRLDRALFSPHSDQSDPEGGVHTALLRQVKAVQAERDQLKQKLEQLRCELNLILNSRSWRFTRFLRRDGPEA